MNRQTAKSGKTELNQSEQFPIRSESHFSKRVRGCGEPCREWQSNSANPDYYLINSSAWFQWRLEEYPLIQVGEGPAMPPGRIMAYSDSWQMGKIALGS
jgi:hypothetical protein